MISEWDENKGAVDDTIKHVRFKNTNKRKQYLWGEFIDSNSLQYLTSKEAEFESAMLALRTDLGILLADYEHLFVEWWEDLISEREQDWFVKIDVEKGWMKLRGKWLDVYNSVITELFAEV